MTSKKNWTLRAAVLMLALVLITSCFVGGTFAKYVTSKSGTDSARVAKFGVTVTANGDVFAKEYDTDDQTVVGTIAKSVISTDKVVAPGTTSNGDFVAATITGTPEVAVRVSYKLDAATLQLENWKDGDGQFYCPLVFKVKTPDGNTVISGMEFQTAEAMKAALVRTVAAYTKDYAPGTDLSGKAAETLAISWEWPFETGTDADKPANNIRDTFLGDEAAAGRAATVSLTLATTVTQID